jgi:hypothetical protein
MAGFMTVINGFAADCWACIGANPMHASTAAIDTNMHVINIFLFTFSFPSDAFP